MAEDHTSSGVNDTLNQPENYEQNKKLAQDIKNQTNLEIDTQSFNPEQRKFVYQLLEERRKSLKNFTDRHKSGIESYTKKALLNPTIEELKNSVEFFKKNNKERVYGLTSNTPLQQRKMNQNYFNRTLNSFKENPDHKQIDAIFEKQVAKLDSLSKKQTTPPTRGKTEEELQREKKEMEEKSRAYSEFLGGWVKSSNLLEREFLPNLAQKQKEAKQRYNLEQEENNKPRINQTSQSPTDLQQSKSNIEEKLNQKLNNRQISKNQKSFEQELDELINNELAKKSQQRLNLPILEGANKELEITSPESPKLSDLSPKTLKEALSWGKKITNNSSQPTIQSPSKWQQVKNNLKIKKNNNTPSR